MNKVVIFLLFYLYVLPAFAHAPSVIDAEYDLENNKLEITVKHTTHNRGKHYIKRLSIQKNTETPIIRFFHKQSRSDKHTYNLDMDLKYGDKITVDARCKKGGSKQASPELNIPEPEPEKPEQKQPQSEPVVVIQEPEPGEIAPGQVR